MSSKVIFYYPGMEKLARDVALGVDGKLGRIEWARFEDEFPESFISDIDLIEGNDVIFFASFYRPDVIFEQLSIIYAIPRYQAKTFTIVLPFYPTATMERVDILGQIATAKTMARLLSATPPCFGGGVPRIIYFDEHVQNLRSSFDNTIIPVPLSAMSLAKEKLSILSDPVVAFPDSGSAKRFGRHFLDSEPVICDKVRQGNERIVTIKEGDPRGKDILIIDDLTRSGGTILKCTEALFKAGAKTVSTFVTHGVFDLDHHKKFRAHREIGDGNLSFFWTTNSCPEKVAKLEGAPFEVLTLADIIVEKINR